MSTAPLALQILPGVTFTHRLDLYRVVTALSAPRRNGTRPKMDTWYCQRIDRDTGEAIGGLLTFAGETIRRAIAPPPEPRQRPEPTPAPVPAPEFELDPDAPSPGLTARLRARRRP